MASAADAEIVCFDRIDLQIPRVLVEPRYRLAGSYTRRRSISVDVSGAGDHAAAAFGDEYTYHVRPFAPKSGAPHLEIQRTYKGTADINPKHPKEWLGRPSGEKTKTSAGEPGVLLDVFHWTHEASTVCLDTPRGGACSFETSEPTGLNSRSTPDFHMYTALVTKQDPSFARVDPFLDRKELESKCDDD